MHDRHLLLPGLLISAACLAPALSDGDDAAERKKLEGVWNGFVVQGRGDRTDRGLVTINDLKITSGKITWPPEKGVGLDEGTYQLDLAKNPRALDSTGTAGDVKGRSFLGIYAVEGDTLKWCVAGPDNPRPTEFVSRPPRQFYMVLKRQK